MCKKTISTFEFYQRYPDGEVARKHFENIRWRGKPFCPLCDEKDRIQTRKRAGYYRCSSCKKDFTVRTGTIFAKSNVKLHIWFHAIYLLMLSRKGVSSLQLSKELGVSQPTSWFMLQRIREACGGDMEKLQGIVEIDETYIGGKEKNRHVNKKIRAGRGGAGKQAVLGLRERGGHTIAKSINDTSMATMHKVIGGAVEFGSTIYTDEHRSYDRLHTAYTHGTVRHSAGEYVREQAHTNGIESVWALLKRGIYGTYHHVSVKHLNRYVNEFSFRLNEGNVDRHVLDRLDSVLCGAIGKQLPYKELVA